MVPPKRKYLIASFLKNSFSKEKVAILIFTEPALRSLGLARLYK
jgi:hypothetical protein